MPLIELTVTSNVLSLIAVSEEIIPVAEPVEVNRKSHKSTPVTLSLNVTRYRTLVQLVDDSIGYCRLIELTVGATLSII